MDKEQLIDRSRWSGMDFVPGVDICVVPWNSPKWLNHFLGQARAKTSMPYRMLISDNSDKPEPQDGDTVENWWHGSNIGCSRAMNRAIHRSNAEYIVIANLDIDLPKYWLSALVSSLINTRFSVIVPMVNGNTPAQTTKGKGVVECYSTPCFALWLTSKRRLFNLVGYFDERFTVIGCGDIYFSWRMWKNGLAIGVDKEVAIHHHMSKVVEESAGGKAAYDDKIPKVRELIDELYGEKVSHIKPGTDGTEGK